MTRPVPRAYVGGRISDKQWEAIAAFYTAHPDRTLPGTIITPKIANEAIDWYNRQERTP